MAHKLIIDVPLTIRLIPDVFMQRLADLKGDQLTAVFPYTMKRLGELGQVGASLWREKASQVPGAEGRPLRLGTGPADPMVRLNRTDYVNSIHVEPSQDQGDHALFIVSTDPQAVVIEKGGVEIDLHKVLAYAPKARLSREGKKYLRIPFRHATTEPGSHGQRFQVIRPQGSNVLPKAVHAAMKKKSPYLITGSYLEQGPNVKKGKVQRFFYTKSDGLKAQELKAMGIDPAELTGQRLVGLMRTGTKGHSQYLTIRTLSEANDHGWKIQPYQAQQVAANVANSIRALASDWFDESVRADVQNWLAQAGSST